MQNESAPAAHADTAVANSRREALGDFSSVVCLKAINTGMEDILGVQATSVSLTSAGRLRGKAVSEELGVVWGALERILGKRYRGTHTESVLRGGSQDVFRFEER